MNCACGPRLWDSGHLITLASFQNQRRCNQSALKMDSAYSRITLETAYVACLRQADRSGVRVNVYFPCCRMTGNTGKNSHARFIRLLRLHLVQGLWRPRIRTICASSFDPLWRMPRACTHAGRASPNAYSGRPVVDWACYNCQPENMIRYLIIWSWSASTFTASFFLFSFHVEVLILCNRILFFPAHTVCDKEKENGRQLQDAYKHSGRETGDRSPESTQEMEGETEERSYIATHRDIKPSSSAPTTCSAVTLRPDYDYSNSFAGRSEKLSTYDDEEAEVGETEYGTSRLLCHSRRGKREIGREQE